MKLREIYDIAIHLGMVNDPRGLEGAKKDLEKAKKAFDKSSDKEKEYFDMESLNNPYADSRVLYGDLDTEVKTLICGVDMETPELLLADRLREKGRNIDLVIAHHPEGNGYANLSKVMGLQAGLMEKYGVYAPAAEGALNIRINEVARSVAPSNHQRAVDSARLLDMPFMCLHTPADNMVSTFLTEELNRAKCETVGDVVDALMEIPEYQQASKMSNPPRIVSGTKETSCGKLYVDFTGGTSGSVEEWGQFVQAGIGTVICMHCGEKHIEEAKKHYVNVVIAGHMSSDSIGLNLLLDAFEAKGVEIIPASGLIRVSRNKK